MYFYEMFDSEYLSSKTVTKNWKTNVVDTTEIDGVYCEQKIIPITREEENLKFGFNVHKHFIDPYDLERTTPLTIKEMVDALKKR